MLRVEGDLDLFTEVTQGHKWTQKWKSELSKDLTDFVDTCFTQVAIQLHRLKLDLVLRHTQLTDLLCLHKYYGRA